MAPAILEKEVAYLRADVGKDDNSHLESTKGISKTVAKNVYDSFNSPDNVEK